MVGVLGIDAAWTEKEPSGVALLEGSPGHRRCVVAIEVGARGRVSLL
jgi:predicted RNase H-like nuclease